MRTHGSLGECLWVLERLISSHFEGHMLLFAFIWPLKALNTRFMRAPLGWKVEMPCVGLFGERDPTVWFALS